MLCYTVHEWRNTMEMNANMDPNLLLSLVNTKLRNTYTSLEDLSQGENLDKTLIVETLELIDYYYDEKENQFKAK